MKLHDFDSKFYDYVATYMALHPGLNENQIEQRYNEMMNSWLNAPAKWLDGEKPGEYFNRYSDPKDLMKLLEAYETRDIGLPEPLYSRIVALGDACAEPLVRIAANADKPEALRATAMALLRDIGSDAPRDMYIDMVSRCRETDELCEMAAEVLAEDETSVDALMARYEDAPDYAQLLILDICSNFSGNERVYEALICKLRNDHENIGLIAAMLASYGDARAIEPLRKMLDLTELRYIDYCELRSAIEALGGDPGEERTFNGDPDYEALRNI